MPSTDRKMVTVTTTCVAEVTETWRYSVPGDWTEETTEDYYDVLSRLQEDESAEFIDVEDESTEERDREVTNVTVGELPPVAPQFELPPDAHPVALIYNKAGDEGSCYTLRLPDGSEREIADGEDTYWHLAGVLDDAFEV